MLPTGWLPMALLRRLLPSFLFSRQQVCKPFAQAIQQHQPPRLVTLPAPLPWQLFFLPSPKRNSSFVKLICRSICRLNRSAAFTACRILLPSSGHPFAFLSPKKSTPFRLRLLRVTPVCQRYPPHVRHAGGIQALSPPPPQSY